MRKTWSSPEMQQCVTAGRDAGTGSGKRLGKEQVMGSAEVNGQPRGEARRERKTNV